MPCSNHIGDTTLKVVLLLFLIRGFQCDNSSWEFVQQMFSKLDFIPRTPSEDVTYANLQNIDDNIKTIVSTNIRNYMDASVDPCDDFYEYACGNFEGKTKLDQLRTKLTASLITILANNTNEIQTSSDQKIRKLFKSCTNLIGKCKEKLSQILEFSQTIGSWPLLNESGWSSVDFNWFDRVAKLRQYGIQSLLYETVQRHPKNPDEIVIILGPGPVEDKLTRKTMSEESNSIKEEYLKKVTGKLTVAGISRETANEAAEEILKFQKDRLDLLKDWQIQYDNITEITFDELKKKFPDRNWNKYFETIADKNISGSDKLLILNENLLSDVLNHFDCIDPEVLANYMFYKLMDKLGSLEISHCNYCIYDLQEVMGTAFSSLYLREYYDKRTRDRVLDMVNYVKWSMRQILKNAGWMDTTTRKEAKLKLSKITPLVGYYNEIVDTSWVDDLYKHLEIDSNNFVKSAFRALQHKTQIEHSAYNKIDEQEIFSVDLTAAAVALIPELNLLVVPPVLQSLPLFHSNLPKSFNFAVLGSLIGRQLTHAFDTTGKCYDNFGNYRKWWSKKSEFGYENASKCFVDFYGNYTFSSSFNTKIDGSKTLYENIADNGGMKLAYTAYNTWYNEHKDLEGVAEDEVLPGIDLTNKQLFFLAYTQSFCEWRVYRELLVKKFQKFPYSPEKFRALGSLSNFKDFSTEFGCALGSNMNPKNKCQIW